MEILKRETREVEVVSDRVCDFCGMSMFDGGIADDEATGERFYGEVTGRYVERLEGEPFAGRTIKADCCRSCWEAKVIPSLKALGMMAKLMDDDAHLPVARIR